MNRTRITLAMVILAIAALWIVSPIGLFRAPGNEDLEQFIDDIKSRPAEPIEPLPRIQLPIRYPVSVGAPFRPLIEPEEPATD